ncbi:MAG: hypothetical protein AVDCRST_MAG56-7200 [uncultured Cytophagales bacterium]|uniref:Uncharacterized protein n=1 Tax=uncultured Cytophagales bacterium TaxID=158755 RepID=A0A6J4LBV7_9SPHI|nr:MAG: hypothetical protein AVDCRST_MAG56-7200 [uncultured Cytophagales bacterium]
MERNRWQDGHTHQYIIRSGYRQKVNSLKFSNEKYLSI